MVARWVSICLILSIWTGSVWGATITGTVSFFGKLRQNAAVHLVGVKADVKAPAQHGVIVQKGQAYIPQVLPVVKGTTVDFPNKDTVFHNAFSLTPGNAFDFGTYGPGKNPGALFNVPVPTDIFCNMHEQMQGLVLVLEHPFFDLTSKEGTYEIKDVPEGTYVIKAWIDPNLSEEKTVTVGPSGTVKIDFEVKK
ncbi:MAG: hypothetical protein MPW14_09490 [Candidatus Manganitrophus sp.]|nr:hypothetical protein [Candidatus Manganitrophus sp.]WDT81922.1 MAG: hypothetical protein MPW14_09490 [Candidatus Manganitrophus sp.]